MKEIDKIISYLLLGSISHKDLSVGMLSIGDLKFMTYTFPAECDIDKLEKIINIDGVRVYGDRLMIRIKLEDYDNFIIDDEMRKSIFGLDKFGL